MPAELMVEVVRGGRVESEHYGHAAVVDNDGRLLFSLGDPDHRIYLRSSAKPFQTMAVVLSGAADRYQMTSADLAIATASHTAEAVHQEQVTGLLSRVGQGVEDLQCGAHPPADSEAAEELRRQGLQPTALHNNCSGKHAGMLGVAKALGADIGGYLSPDAPGQRLVRRIVSAFCGVPEEEIGIGVDGCSAPVFQVPVRALALGFARLADPSGMPQDYALAARRVQEAMVEHPYLVAGRGRIGVDLMQASSGRLVAKTGAEAVYGVGDRSRGQGLALKLMDGSHRAVAPALVESLLQAGFLRDAEAAALKAWHRPVQHNFAGREVGEIRPSFRLRA
ncbi:MAG: asparaginase [Thermaerobacter sp.]|nr:asparaginase [Thermaerobacter sp.]